MNVVITGASRGIGLELTKAALASQAIVLAVARQPQESKGLSELAKKYPTTLKMLSADMFDVEVADKILAACAAFAEVDMLINNAGMYPKGEKNKDFHDGFQVNTVAPFLISKALLPKLQKAKAPKIVQVTSKMGSIADNASGSSCAYRASKTALNMLNKCLAVQYSWLTTIVIHPGWVKTDMGGSEAPVEVADSAQGIWKVARDLEARDSGKFFDFRGENIPW
jgi:NAD(P)-dependent dehydrogenase (short-subunit alcohol dehydrogenase family)